MPYNVRILTTVDKNNPDKTYERSIAFYADYARSWNYRLVSLWNINIESPYHHCQCCFFDFHDNNSCDENKVRLVSLPNKNKIK